jgi:hypothetical protein
VSHGVSKGKGIYLLDGIPRVDNISLFVMAPNHGFAASLGEVGMLGAARFGRMVEPGEETRIEVPMASLGSIYGRVIDSQTGEGVSAASIQVLSGESDQARMSLGLTDAKGEYRIQGLAAGSVTIYVRSPGYEAESVGVPFENDGDASSVSIMAVHGEAVAAPLIQLKLGRIVSGHCLDVAGNPVEGALMSYRSSPTGHVVVDKMLAGGNTMCASTTDGHFELSGLPTQGEIVLRAVHMGFPGGGKTTVSDGATEDVIIVLKQGGAIHGQVLRSDGSPMAEIGIHAAPGGETSITDKNGEFVLAAVAEGEVTLSIESGISQRLDAVESKVKVIDGEVARITLQVEAMPSIRGRVLDESGVPIAGAAIRISASSGAAMESDSNGEFVLRFLTEGQHTLFVWRDGYRSAQVSGVDAGERNVIVTLRTNQ